MIALSLPTGYLAGAYRNDEDRLWLAMYGEPDAGLQRLRDGGVRGVELRDVRSISQPDVVERALARVSESGLVPTAHLWLPEAPSPDVGNDELRSMMRATDQALRRQGVTTARSPCAVHGRAQRAFGTAQQAVDATVRDLAALARACAAGDVALAPSLELCRLKPGGPVGTSFTELCHIVDTAEEANAGEDAVPIGICWDMGHTLSNHHLHRLPLHPPSTFLHRTNHTHIHELGQNGRTHAPLLDETSPIAEMIRRLRDSGYVGTYDLELEPTRWNASASDCRRAVDASVHNVMSILGQEARSARRLRLLRRD